MVRAFSAFLNFYYITCCEFLTEDMLVEMQEYLNWFYHYRTVFITTGVCEDLNPLCQYSLRHYIQLIQDYGALNGVYSSITKLAHIRAVKKPWCRSSQF